METHFHRIHRIVHGRERTVRRSKGFQSIATNTTTVQRGNHMCGKREEGEGGKEKKGETSGSEEKEYLK